MLLEEIKFVWTMWHEFSTQGIDVNELGRRRLF